MVPCGVYCAELLVTLVSPRPSSRRPIRLQHVPTAHRASQQPRSTATAQTMVTPVWVVQHWVAKRLPAAITLPQITDHRHITIRTTEDRVSKAQQLTRVSVIPIVAVLSMVPLSRRLTCPAQIASSPSNAEWHSELQTEPTDPQFGWFFSCNRPSFLIAA